MGRLFQWIRSVSTARAANARSAALSRRRLRFERCESRIALSTNVGDLKTEFDGSEQFAATDGGLISLSFDFSTVAASESAIGTFNVEDFKDLRDQTFILSTNGTLSISGEALVSVVRGRLEDIFVTREFNDGTLTSFGESSLSNNKGFDVPGLTADGDYNLTLQSPEQSSPSINSDLSVIPTPMPSEQPSHGSNEGGQIALTPFVAPTGLTLSNGHGTEGIARAKSRLEELSGRGEARSDEAIRSEGLRGRAVVYEVADAASTRLHFADQPEGDVPADDRAEIELASLTTLSPASFNKREQQTAEAAHAPATPAAAEEAAVAEEAGLPPEVVDFLEAIELSSLNGDDVAVAPMLNGTSQSDAAKYDAAFAEWGTEGSLASADVHADSNDHRDRRMLGLGAAVALTFVPLRKAWRRRGEANLPAANHYHK
ncbi:hypothetical protein [Lacipirellula parvula]|uniref:Uncharacterized protein n=1 Tax=Lacipirellula parvula TaxID=2650471 RepID=A0A5K7XCX2_9BACT|nr:hypothetical protein [Lacipirellula parvula]BBO34670.1 hypothetical protein PLANPX_4282 [Lacipirellula parvula]